MATLTINFTPTDPAPTGGYIVKYRVKGSTGAYTTVSPNPTSSPVVINGLAAGTEYEGTIQGDCGSIDSDTVPFSTCTCPAGYVRSAEGEWCEDTDTTAPTITATDYHLAPSTREEYTEFFARIYNAGWNNDSISELSAPTDTFAEMTTLNLWKRSSHIRPFDATGVSTGSDEITVSGHDLSVGDIVRYTDEGNTAPGGLLHKRNYYVHTVVDADTIKLSTKEGGSEIDLTSQGTGTAHLLTKYTSAMNRCSVWIDADNDGLTDPLTAGQKVTIAAAYNNTGAQRTVYIGIGSDNRFELTVNGVQIAETTSPSSMENFKIWHIFPVTLLQGWNYFNAVATGDGSVNDAIGMEIYDNTNVQIRDAESLASLNILFSTESVRGQQINVSTCPSGYNLDTSGGVGSYICVRTLREECGGVAT